jgi:hypothetical protein
MAPITEVIQTKGSRWFIHPSARITSAFFAGAGVQEDVQGHAFRGAFLHDMGGNGLAGRARCLRPWVGVWLVW